MSNDRVAMSRRRDRAQRTVAWFGTARALDKQLEYALATSRRRAVRTAIFWFFEAARQHALGHIADFPAERRAFHLRRSAEMPNDGWGWRHAQFEREARRQWREITWWRRSMPPLWHEIDAATWDKPGWSPLASIEVAECIVEAGPGAAVKRASDVADVRLAMMEAAYDAALSNDAPAITQRGG